MEAVKRKQGNSAKTIVLPIMPICKQETLKFEPTMIAVGGGRVILNNVSLILRVLGKKLYSEQV